MALPSRLNILLRKTKAGEKRTKPITGIRGKVVES